jgi:hypothetical protein
VFALPRVHPRRSTSKSFNHFCSNLKPAPYLPTLSVYNATAALVINQLACDLIRLLMRCCYVKHYEPVLIVCQILFTNKCKIIIYLKQ